MKTRDSLASTSTKPASDPEDSLPVSGELLQMCDKRKTTAGLKGLALHFIVHGVRALRAARLSHGGEDIV